MRELKVHEHLLMPFIVTLCGSTKFKEEFEGISLMESLKGNIVILPSFYSHAHNLELTKEEDLFLNDLHMRKISISDSIFVINKDGYIGASTKSQIKYAHSKSITVRYLEPLKKEEGEEND